MLLTTFNLTLIVIFSIDKFNSRLNRSTMLTHKIHTAMDLWLWLRGLTSECKCYDLRKELRCAKIKWKIACLVSYYFLMKRFDQTGARGSTGECYLSGPHVASAIVPAKKWVTDKMPLFFIHLFLIRQRGPYDETERNRHAQKHTNHTQKVRNTKTSNRLSRRWFGRECSSVAEQQRPVRFAIHSSILHEGTQLNPFCSHCFIYTQHKWQVYF